MPKYRILFLGQKLFGEAAWHRLIRCDVSEFNVLAVSTNKLSERVWWKSNRIYQNCGKISVIDNSARNTDALQLAIERYNINLILCVQHPWILPAKILRLVDYQAINFHNAKLPDYRGYNAVNHAILNGEKEFTCTAHWMSDEVDTGAIIRESTFNIDPRETAISLYAKCHHAGLALFDEVICMLDAGNPIPRRPILGEARFYSRQSIEGLREIRNPSTSELDVKARAFYFPPFEPAFVNSGTHKLYVLPEVLFDHSQSLNSTTPSILERHITDAEKTFKYQIQ